MRKNIVNPKIIDMKPKTLFFASGSRDGGGSGFEVNVNSSRVPNGIVDTEIVGVVSNYENGGVREKADRLGIPFIYFPGPWTAESYQRIANESGADFFALSGWLPKVKGLDLSTKFNPRSVFNIHPGPLPKFGGKGFYGHHVHEAVVEAFRRGEITHTAVTMHFVTEEFDQGPVFFEFRIMVKKENTPEDLASRVNFWEHYFQPQITDLVVHGLITWDGINKDSLVVPKGYSIVQQ
jgi:phosphoribosylglycinamide formyltransferase-1